ncbi:Pathogenesis-related thaumatin superfamily protein [Striga hermonthica]|uniref:Pathogenesis-related thaumatin superfamily protein n=1 Tax=Striga hermonthica TaxID=68872 RepID=A0A9N7NFZ5_STRHE|nr:Pathogenesis-related thaumatin superfamily protein [Striga hermonthica]
MLILTFLFSTTLNTLLSLTATSGLEHHQLILVNNCNETIWPAIQAGAGHPTPQDGGFQLSTNQEIVLNVPNKWSGRIWARQSCNFDPNGQKGSCATGDCSGQLGCRGLGGLPPATLNLLNNNIWYHKMQ